MTAKHLIYALIIFVYCSCKSTRPIYENTTRSDTTIVREKAVIVEIPGATVTQEIDYDKIRQMVRRSKDQIIIKEDAEGIARLTLELDSINGTLIARCQALEQEREILINEFERIIKEERLVIKEENKGFLGEVEGFVKKLLWVVGIAWLIQMFGPMLFRLIRPI